MGGAVLRQLRLQHFTSYVVNILVVFKQKEGFECCSEAARKALEQASAFDIQSQTFPTSKPRLGPLL